MVSASTPPPRIREPKRESLSRPPRSSTCSHAKSGQGGMRGATRWSSTSSGQAGEGGLRCGWEEEEMNEVTWLSGTYPMGMVRHLGEAASERKLSLLAAACFRRIWHLLPGPKS